MSSTEPILTMRGIEKSFGAEVKALKGVDFEVRPGEIVALLGENGAGKSTLLKAITGVHTPTAGEVRWFGEPVVLDSPAKARALGIRTVYQELNLAPHLSVAANIYLGAEPMKNGLLDHKAMREKAQALLTHHGFDLNPDALVGTLGPAQRQAVEICKALSEEAKLLLLDEPTSSLGEKEIEELFTTLKALRERGIGMVFVSHRLPECFDLCDRVIVLRDGLKVYEAAISETDTSTVVRAMVGRELSDFYPRVASEPGKPRLQVDLVMKQGFNANTKVQVQEVLSKHVEDVAAPAPHLLTLGDRITFTAHAGEVVGIAGLMGAGRTELLEAIFGLRRPFGGTVLVDGKPLPLNQGPRAAIKAGVGMLTEDRKRTGLALGLPVRHNVTLAGLEKIAPGPWLSHGPDKSATKTEIERLRIKTSSTETLIGTLSGGNQQKGVLGRWLHAGSSVLLFDEPTRGVDVGSKVEIYEQMNLLTQSGATIVLVSSELPELLGMSDRVLVLFQGRLVANIARHDATPDRVLHYMMTGKDIAL